MRPNWVKIRYEYITTTISYRELAAKYNAFYKGLICSATGAIIRMHCERSSSSCRLLSSPLQSALRR